MKPNTSGTIELPASLRSDGVRDHPGMPFGFLPELAFSFAGIPTGETAHFQSREAQSLGCFTRVILCSLARYSVLPKDALSRELTVNLEKLPNSGEKIATER
jgi:hypothetical protein